MDERYDISLLEQKMDSDYMIVFVHACDGSNADFEVDYYYVMLDNISLWETVCIPHQAETCKYKMLLV